MKRELGIARCGLACCLCSENVTCKGCRRDGFMELSWCKDAEWCEVRRCGIDKDIAGCYECEPANCRKGLYADKIKARAFAEFAKRYGVDELLDCLERNEKAGIIYHREGIMGDYDEFDDLEELIGFIKTGKRINDSIIIKPAETDEELCGRGYVHCTSWQEAYRGIVSDRYLDTMTVEATTARARKFPENTLIAKDKDKVVGFAVYGPSRDEDLPDAGEVDAIYILSEYYGRKVGYRLMNEAVSRLKECNTVFLWVFEKNERAIRFYHRYGFEFDGCKKEWNLGGPVTLVRMIKKRE